jgi:hypothetical protein
LIYGGEGEIRTPDRVTPMPDFKSGAVPEWLVFEASSADRLVRCYL